MDWSKAKNIFIVAFLLLNILLGYQLYLKQSENIQNYQWASNNIEELKKILKQRNINVKVEIPQEAPKLKFLNVKNIEISNYKDINLDKDEAIEGNYSIDSILKDIIYKFAEYKYNPIESNNKNYFVYNQVMGKIPYFEAEIEANITDNGYVSYTQNYFEILSEGLDRQVISAYSALRTVLDQQLIPKNAIIEEITLGYHGQSKQSSTQMLTPVWRITYKVKGENTELLVNAMTGGLQNTVTY